MIRISLRKLEERKREKRRVRESESTRYTRSDIRACFPSPFSARARVLLSLAFCPSGPSRLLVYSLYYAFPARWTGNAKIRRVCGGRTRTYKQRPRKRRRVRMVLSEKCYGLVDAIDLSYNELIKRTRTYL